jgi:hypothetical protein
LSSSRHRGRSTTELQSFFEPPYTPHHDSLTTELPWHGVRHSWGPFLEAARHSKYPQFCHRAAAETIVHSPLSLFKPKAPYTPYVHCSLLEPVLGRSYPPMSSVSSSRQPWTVSTFLVHRAAVHAMFPSERLLAPGELLIINPLSPSPVG